MLMVLLQSKAQPLRVAFCQNLVASLQAHNLVTRTCCMEKKLYRHLQNMGKSMRPNVMLKVVFRSVLMWMTVRCSMVM